MVLANASIILKDHGEIRKSDLTNPVRWEAQKILDCGVDLNDNIFEKMKAALIWFNKKEPRKDPPNHINFFKSFIINKGYKNTKSKG